MAKKIAFSVLIPLKDEQGNLAPLFARLKTCLGKLRKSFEVIFIDDGSQDESGAEIDQIIAKNKQVKKITLRRNFGKSTALAVGFEKAGGEVVITMDADLQDRPDQLAKLIKKLEKENYDLVCGWRYQRQDRLSKKIASFFFNRFTCLLTGVKLHDINCGFKVFRRGVVKNIKIYGELHRFIPVIAKGQGFKVGEVKIKHAKRKFGKSKFDSKRYFSGFIDLLTVMLLTRYSRKPLHVFGLLGLGSFFSGGLILSFFMARKYFLGILIGAGRPIIQAGFFLMIFGVQILIFGLLAEIIVNNQKHDLESLIKKNE